jgi:hypothetical protein
MEIFVAVKDHADVQLSRDEVAALLDLLKSKAEAEIPRDVLVDLRTTLLGLLADMDGSTGISKIWGKRRE